MRSRKIRTRFFLLFFYYTPLLPRLFLGNNELQHREQMSPGIVSHTRPKFQILAGFSHQKMGNSNIPISHFFPFRQHMYGMTHKSCLVRGEIRQQEKSDHENKVVKERELKNESKYHFYSFSDGAAELRVNSAKGLRILNIYHVEFWPYVSIYFTLERIKLLLLESPICLFLNVCNF